MKHPLSPSPQRLRSLGLVSAAAVVLSVGALATAQRGSYGGMPGATGHGAGAGAGHGLHLGAHLETVTVDFYDVDPSTEGATPLASAELDMPFSPDALRELAEAEAATYAVVRGLMTHTLDLEALSGAGGRPGLGRGATHPFGAAAGPMAGTMSGPRSGAMTGAMVGPHGPH